MSYLTESGHERTKEVFNLEPAPHRQFLQMPLVPVPPSCGSNKRDATFQPMAASLLPSCPAESPPHFSVEERDPFISSGNPKALGDSADIELIGPAVPGIAHLALLDQMNALRKEVDCMKRREDDDRRGSRRITATEAIFA